MNKPENMYVVIPMVEANGHNMASVANRRLCVTEASAIETAQGMLDKRTYNSMFIYKAVIQVRRTAPPIEVLPVI